MFAIQTNAGKFVQVNYYLDLDKVWDLVFSKNAKKYKTRDEAAKQAIKAYEFCVAASKRCIENIAEKEGQLNKANKRLTVVNAALAENGVKPYYEVREKMAKLEKEHAKLTQDIEYAQSSLQTYKRTLNEWNRKVAAGYNVVTVTEVVTK